MIEYYKTFNKLEDGLEEIHICTPGLDSAIYGTDLSGDDLIHSKDPIKLTGRNYNITCDHCARIINVVKEYLKIK